MQRLITTSLLLVAATLPASAFTHRHHATGAHRSFASGMPITAEPDSIRINSVGQVISQPVPVIEKEKNFNSRTQRDLSKPFTETAPGAPALQKP